MVVNTTTRVGSGTYTTGGWAAAAAISAAVAAEAAVAVVSMVVVVVGFDYDDRGALANATAANAFDVDAACVIYLRHA